MRAGPEIGKQETRVREKRRNGDKKKYKKSVRERGEGREGAGWIGRVRMAGQGMQEEE